nr:PcfJ domain-containing protein [Thiorhodovibrio winogradskyi]
MQQFDQISQLCRLHDRLVAAQMRQESWRLRRFDANGKVVPYPPAPFADTQSIQAIKTPDALQAETEEMAHCVSSYSERIYNGRYAVYKVLAPERLTLGLKIHDGRVLFDQLRGVANQTPSQQAQAAVEQWFRDCLEGSRQARPGQASQK